MPVRHPGKRLLLFIVSEVVGIMLMIAFVIALANMPPLQVIPTQQSVIGYSFKLDTAQWKKSVTGYLKQVQTQGLGKTNRGVPVGPIVSERLGKSLVLISVAGLIAVVLGVVKGFWDFEAMRRRKVALGPMITSALGALPDFWLVLLLQLTASWMWRKLDITPPRSSYAAEDPISSLIFPLITLSLIPLAQVARITATAMNNVYDREFIRTARAKGLREFKVIYKHALRNAVVQILDGMPGVMAVMVSNLLIVEFLFNYPGMTTLLKEAIAPSVFSGTRFVGSAPPDIAVVVLSGVTLGLIFTSLYLVVQVIRRIADPRLKGGGTP